MPLSMVPLVQQIVVANASDDALQVETVPHNVVSTPHSQRRPSVMSMCGTWCYTTLLYGEEVDGSINR